MQRLRPKEALFVVRVLEGASHRKAYELAGYSCAGTAKTVQKRADEVAGRPRIAGLIECGREKALGKAEVTCEGIVDELAATGFARLSDVVDWEDERFTVRAFSTLSPATLTALKNVKVTQTVTEEGDKKTTVLRIEVHMNDKLRALDMLMGWKGMKKGDALQEPVQIFFE